MITRYAGMIGLLAMVFVSPGRASSGAVLRLGSPQVSLRHSACEYVKQQQRRESLPSDSTVSLSTPRTGQADDSSAWTVDGAGERGEIAAASHLPKAASGWAKVISGDCSIEFRPIGATGTLVDSGAGGVMGRCAWPATTLKYFASSGRIKEYVILKGDEAPHEFSYALRMNGLTPEQMPDGSIVLTAVTGSPLEIAAPWMEDAAGRRSTAIKVSLRRKSTEYVYTLTPDPRWLASAQYPVVIDPTVTQQCNNSWRAVVSDWGFKSAGVDSSGYSSGSYLAADILNLSMPGLWGRWRSVLNFGSSLSDLNLPPDAQITDARLRFDAGWDGANTLYVSGTTPITLQACDVASVGTYSSASWSSLETARQSSQAVAPSVTLSNLTPTARHFEIPVTSIVSKWVSRGGGTQTILIRDTADTSQPYFLNGLRFLPTDGGVLQITYTNREVSEGWPSHQGGEERHGRSYFAVSDSAVETWSFALPAGVPLGSGYKEGASLLVVPDPNDSNCDHPLVIAITDATNNVGFHLNVVKDGGSSAAMASIPFGNPMWDQGATQCTPAVAAGRLFTSQQYGASVEAVSFRSLTNPVDAGTFYFSSGSISNSHLIRNPASSGVILAVDQLDASGAPVTNLCSFSPQNGGALEWITPLAPSSSGSSPVADASATYIADSGNVLGSYTLTGGVNTWMTDLPLFGWQPSEVWTNPPTVAGGSVYVPMFLNSAGSGAVSCVTNVGGSPYTLWSSTTDPVSGDQIGRLPGSVALSAEDAEIVVADTGVTGRGSRVYAFGLAGSGGAGSSKWPQSYTLLPSEHVVASPVVAGTAAGPRRVYVAANDTGGSVSHVYVIDAATGQPVNPSQPYLGGTAMAGSVLCGMAAYRGSLYVLTDNGVVHKFH